MRLHVIIFGLVYLAHIGNCAKILAVVFTPSFSHQLAFRPLWKELAQRGHQITLLTTDPAKDDPEFEKINQIDLHGSYKIMEERGSSKILSNGASNGKGILSNVLSYWDALDDAASWQLAHPEVKALIQNRSESFDLVITEIMNPIHMAFAERFKVPFIGIASLDAPYRIHDAIGNYMHPTLYPDYFLPFAPPLTFVQRLLSVIFNWFQWTLMYFRQYPRQTEIARMHFGENLRTLGEIEKDMSFLFITVNPLFHRIRPMGLNTIIIGGGTHVKTSKKHLPTDLQSFMDNAREGAIYVSFGTNVKSVLLEDSLRNTLLEVFAALPYKIVWKFEDENIEGLPKNVKIVKWVPQQDLLAHSNLKLFITQCGLQSMEEAIFNHVPVVGITFMGDQHSNGQTLESKGLGFSFHRKFVTKESLEKAILEVITNPRYRENVLSISELSKDVEKSGQEKAVWWTEYCIRTRGAIHLRSPAIDMPTYQFYMLDITAFFITVLMVLILITVCLFKLCMSCCRRKKTKKD